jgi:spermidine/putrescine transport system permease protein
VTLPLSLPGVIAAFFFVFIPTIGEFVTPSLVGGTGGYMYGNQIVDKFGAGFPDWETGSVLALFLIIVVAVLTAVFSRFLQPQRVGAELTRSPSRATAHACCAASSGSWSSSSTRRS